MKSIASTASGERMTTHVETRMPEEERSGLYDPDEDYPWDCDLVYPLDGGDDDDEEDE